MATWQIGETATHTRVRSMFGTGPTMILRTARIDFPGHGSLAVSRWEDESQWLADAHVKANGFPVFVHGEGDRSCAKKVMADEAIVAALNEAHGL